MRIVNINKNLCLLAAKCCHFIRVQITAGYKLGESDRGWKCCAAGLPIMDKRLNCCVNSLAWQTLKRLNRPVILTAGTNVRNNSNDIRHNQNHQTTNNNETLLFHGALE